jgi:hypothetical protein
MSVPLLIIIGTLLASWSFLSVLGNERQRQVQQREADPKRSTTPAGCETPVGR